MLLVYKTINHDKPSYYKKRTLISYLLFYLSSTFHDNRVNTFGFMEEGGGLLTPPPFPTGPGTPKKPRRNRVKSVVCLFDSFKNGLNALKNEAGLSCIASVFLCQYSCMAFLRSLVAKLWYFFFSSKFS